MTLRRTTSKAASKPSAFMRSLLFYAAIHFPVYLPYIPHVVAVLVG